MNTDIPAPTLGQESFLVASNLKEIDNSAQKRPSIRELLSRSDSSEAFESLSRGEYVGNLLSIVLSNSASLSSPEATGCAGDSKREVKFQTKNRYGRENRRSFMRSVSSIVDEYNDQLTSSPTLSRPDDSDDNLDISVLPRFRRNSFIFNDYKLSKEALMESGLGKSEFS